MADSDSSLTPEKKLLQLIEGGSSEGSSAPKAPAAKKAANPFDKLKDILSPEGIKTFIVDFKSNAVHLYQNRHELISLSGVNAIVKLFTIILGIYLLLNVIYEIKVVNTNYVANLQIPQREMSDISMSDTRIFDTNLLQEVDKLNVFIPYNKREQVEEKTEEKMSMQLVGLIKDWKLAGISIYPDDPGRTFCMVEDLLKSSTTFLKVGDTISGLVVDEIKPDSVTLRFNDETIELR